jgi:hypothetical protein
MSRSIPDRASGDYTGDVIFTRQFTKAAEGLEIVTTLSTSSQDRFTYVWESIPIFISLDKASNAPTTIEYFNGTSWAAVPTEGRTVSTSTVRLGRDHGGGVAYAYVEFSKPENVTLGKEWQGDGEVDDYYRQLLIDLHPNRGNAQAISNTSVSYTISSVQKSKTIPAPKNPRVVELAQ